MSGGVPAGWVLVPVEPTLEMYEAGYDATRLADGTPQFANAGFCLGHSGNIYRAMLAATPPPPIEGRDADVERVIAEAIGKADAAFGYSFNLTRLVDGEATHTLTMPGFEPVDFEDRDEGYALIAERRNAMRAAAIRAALQALGERP